MEVQGWLFQRHAAMASWPEDHEWVIGKLEIEDIWFIDFLGGTVPMAVVDYMGAQLDFTDLMPLNDGSHIVSHGSMATVHGETMHASAIDWGMLFLVVCLGSTMGSWLASSLCSSNKSMAYSAVDNNCARAVHENL